MKKDKDIEGDTLQEALPIEEVKEAELEKVPTFDKSTEEIKERWKPKTDLGMKVKEGAITSIKDILNNHRIILEPEIVDILIPKLESDLLLIGQAKGKFGGGQRRVFKQTQKKTAEGNKPNFATCAVVGNRDGYVGVGYGKSKETVPARDKAIRRAKLNVKQIRRGCGSWECGCKESHSIPYAVEGHCGSVRLTLVPAPKGKGLVAQREVQKILKLAGIKDVWSKSSGKTSKTVNLVYACVDALNKLVTMKVKESHKEKLGLCEGTREGRSHV
jgi:small subunit ribosomal protein S5